MAKITIPDSLKPQMAEAIIDILKMTVYACGIVLLANLLRDDAVKYIEDIEKVRAVTELSIQLKNERTEAASDLVRAAVMLDHTVRVLDTQLSSIGHLSADDERDLRENSHDLSLRFRAFRSLSYDVEINKIGYALTNTLKGVLETLDQSSNPDKERRLKLDLILLESQIPQLINTLVPNL